MKFGPQLFLFCLVSAAAINFACGSSPKPSPIAGCSRSRPHRIRPAPWNQLACARRQPMRRTIPMAKCNLLPTARTTRIQHLSARLRPPVGERVRKESRLTTSWSAKPAWRVALPELRASTACTAQSQHNVMLSVLVAPVAWSAAMQN